MNTGGNAAASESPRADRPAGRRGPLALVFAAFALAALVRSIPWPSVFTPEGVVFTDGDGYAHMWRIWNAASGAMPLSARDLYTNFPHGGEVIWPPGFDWGLATLVAGLGLDRAGAEALCAWAPVVLGAAAVALGALVAAHFFSRAAGWIAGVTLAVLPGSYLYTQLGFLDHHAAMTLIETALLGGAMRIVAARDEGPTAWPWAAGALGALALLVGSRALIPLLVVQGALLSWSVAARDGAHAIARTQRLALAHAVVALAILPFSLRDWELYGRMSPLVPSLFQVVWFGAAAICLALAAASWRFRALGATRPGRLASAAAVGALGLVLAFALIPGLAAVLAGGAGWFTGDVAFLTGIVELEPLATSAYTGLRWGPVLYLSPLVLGFPIAFLTLAWRHRRLEVALLLVWTAVFFVLVLAQLRFVNTFSVAFAIVMGAAIAELLEAIDRRADARRTRHFGRSAVVLAVAAALAVPAWLYYGKRLRDGGAEVASPIREARIDVARFLGRVAPPPLDADGRPTGGVLGSWDTGHEYRYASGWPVHQDGFGPYVSPGNAQLASRYFSAVDEGEALELLERLGTRFVIVDRQGAGLPVFAPRSLTSRLVELRGSGGRLGAAGDPRAVWVPALGRHRLRYAAEHGVGGVWLFEIVAGALVTGSSTPGAEVSIALELGTPWGAAEIWRDRSQADESGTFRFRVPYATRGGPESAFPPTGAYRLRTLQGEVAIEVDEASVLGGSLVPAPAIAP